MFFKRLLSGYRERKAREVQTVLDTELQEVRIAQIREWGERVTRAGRDAEKILACGPPPDGAESYFEGENPSYGSPRECSPFTIYRSVEQWKRLRYELLSGYEGGDPLNALDALSDFYRRPFPFGPTPEYVFGLGADWDYVQGIYSAKLSELAAEIRDAPDPAIAETLFMTYYGLKPESGDEQVERMLLHRILGYADPFEVTLPADWDDMVARFIRTPELHDFRKESSELAELDVLRIASQAVTERSLTKAKLALAYVPVKVTYSGTRYERGHSYYPFREALGDQLVAELSRLVEELHAEMGLFVAK